VLADSVARLEAILSPGARVLDVGGWGKPLARADFVLDLMPHATRGLYGRDGDGPERFGEDSWLQLDICDSARPWPFADGEFDFAVCSHTLEDVRDPVHVCRELQRVARAGYIEVPSRLEEQSPMATQPGVGWTHHRWLVDVDAAAATIDFVFKHGVIYADRRFQFPPGFHAGLSEAERVSTLWWDGSFEARERVFMSADELDPYLEGFVDDELARRGLTRPSRAQRLRSRVYRSM
jgi:hypothetical protein